MGEQKWICKVMYFCREQPQRKKSIIVPYFFKVQVLLTLHCLQQTLQEKCSYTRYKWPIQHVWSICLCEHARRRQNARKRVYVLFQEKHFYPTCTINQLQTKQPLSNKDVLLPPLYGHRHTRTCTTSDGNTLFHIHH